MKNQLISFKVAKLAKEKGFDIPTDARYYWDYKWKLSEEGLLRCDNSDEDRYSAPTQTLLRKWLREEKGIHIELGIDGWGDDNKIDKPCYRAFIWREGHPKPRPSDDLGCADFETILEVSLEHALAYL